MAVQIHDVREVHVERVKDNGIKDQAGQWHNVSRYANVDECPMPNAGQTVRLHLDKDGFIRRIEALSAKLPVEAAFLTKEADKVEQASVSTFESPDDRRQTLIVRQNALSNAVAVILANRSEGSRVRLSDVLDCAQQIESWITR